MEKNQLRLPFFTGALGLVLPFLILSRLDDVFLLPAFLCALLFVGMSWRERFYAGARGTLPSCIAVVCYMVYNKMTVGAAMPLKRRDQGRFCGPVDCIPYSGNSFSSHHGSERNPV